MNLLTWLGGSMPSFDIMPDPDTLAMLEQPAACDKHRELVNEAAIEALQRKIVQRGGKVTIGAYYTPGPIIAAIESDAFLTAVAQHVERLKGRVK